MTLFSPENIYLDIMQSLCLIEIKQKEIALFMHWNTAPKDQN